MRVARGGRSAMADAQLRANIFEPPDTAQVGPRGRGGRRDRAETAEGAARHTGTSGAAGAAVVDLGGGPVGP
jgi:hypothetical protein